MIFFVFFTSFSGYLSPEDLENQHIFIKNLDKKLYIRKYNEKKIDIL